jgi:hypothetical protein
LRARTGIRKHQCLLHREGWEIWRDASWCRLELYSYSRAALCAITEALQLRRALISERPRVRLWGALAYLGKRHADAEVDYLGIDLSPAMLRRARRLWRNHGHAKFVVAHMSPRIADYSVASGIFNVKLDQPIDRWERFIARTLSDMKECSRYGFAVNFKVHCPPSDAPRSELYHTLAEPWICYCKWELGLSVELVTAYGLREFTLLARNEMLLDH